ncbi:MAG TPA: inositol monophosphatase family protein [Pyrinomonadaceae bacterium]|nr:inositol monophosphatase family protein [Pyrinomonadaceae bacterium]
MSTAVGTREMLDIIRRVHERVRDAVVAETERARVDELAEVADDESEGDTIYAVDRVSEELLVEMFETELAERTSLVLVAEGIEGGQLILPRGSSEDEAAWRVVVDPIDGTRGIMYQKRSAWVLTGVARNRGAETNLQDIEVAVQTEIPLVKQHLCDVLWAVRGEGAHGERLNRLTGEREPLHPRPSRATTIRHGFSMIARFFPGARDELAAIDEEIVRGALGPVEHGKAQCFEDQYLSSGGQLYELMMGHDRFVADLRPLIETVMNRRGLTLGLCCHPYDMCTELIAREAGVVVTDERGEPLRSPLRVEPDLAWAGYANEHIRREIEPLLREALGRRGLLADN